LRGLAAPGLGKREQGATGLIEVGKGEEQVGPNLGIKPSLPVSTDADLFVTLPELEEPRHPVPSHPAPSYPGTNYAAEETPTPPDAA